MHIFLRAPVLAFCQKCGNSVKPHTVCSNCGFYKGAEVIDVLKKLTKKERKLKEKEMAAKAGEKEKPLSMEELSKK
ncbi:MAG: hypothetical protein G01um101430_235 [Parcubacteria group bacterium Gr01-1014_30]|nr:MAG: hypothetical protein G01um101430_235 [Parcubacteria group bacterium Gr01-1014_30]